MADSFKELYNKPSIDFPSWITGGVLPKNGILLMGGEAKIGKTFYLLDMAHSLATGGHLWGLKTYAIPVPTVVYYVEQEVGQIEFQRRVKARFEKLGVQPPETMFYSSRLKEFFLDTAQGRTKLHKEITETGAKVVIIDPISRAILGSENDNTQINTLFRYLDELLIDTPELSIVLSHHFSKPSNDPNSVRDPMSPYNFRGAAKFFDAPDTLVTIRNETPLKNEWKRSRVAFEMRQGVSPEVPYTLAITDGGIVKPVKFLGGLLAEAEQRTRGW